MEENKNSLFNLLTILIMKVKSALLLSPLQTTPLKPGQLPQIQSINDGEAEWHTVDLKLSAYTYTIGSVNSLSTIKDSLAVVVVPLDTTSLNVDRNDYTLLPMGVNNNTYQGTNVFGFIADKNGEFCLETGTELTPLQPGGGDALDPEDPFSI